MNISTRHRIQAAIIAAVLCFAGLQACSLGGGRPSFSGGYSNDGPGRLPKAKHLKDAKPKWEKRTRAGNAPKYTVLGKTYYTLDTAENYRRQGTASWYGRKFHGNKTANGEIYDMYSMSAAHKSLPIPSYVRVRNLSNGREAVVRINDRGPFVDDREIDLSFAAAVKLGVYDTGTAAVEVTGIEVKPDGKIVATPSKPTAKKTTQALKTKQPLKAEPIPYSTNRAAISNAEQWWVQAGAFGLIQGANNLSLKLRNEGFANIVVNTPQANLPYKVRIGPFPLETDARWAQHSLVKRGLNKGFVVQNAAP